MRKNVYCSLLRTILWYLRPHCQWVGIGFLFSWRIRTVPYLLHLIRRGWYHCEDCGRRWNTEALGAAYWVERRNGVAQVVGLCARCNAESKRNEPT